MKGLGDELSTFFLSHYSNVTGFQLINHEMLQAAMPSTGNRMKHALIYDAMKILVETLTDVQRAPSIDGIFATMEASTCFFYPVQIFK